MGDDGAADTPGPKYPKANLNEGAGATDNNEGHPRNAGESAGRNNLTGVGARGRGLKPTKPQESLTLATARGIGLVGWRLGSHSRLCRYSLQPNGQGGGTDRAPQFPKYRAQQPSQQTTKKIGPGTENKTPGRPWAVWAVFTVLGLAGRSLRVSLP